MTFFWGSLQKSPESHRNLAHITASPSSQTRHDRHINTPSHLIEHSVHKEEGNTVNVEECSRYKKKSTAKRRAVEPTAVMLKYEYLLMGCH